MCWFRAKPAKCKKFCVHAHCLFAVAQPACFLTWALEGMMRPQLRCTPIPPKTASTQEQLSQPAGAQPCRHKGQQPCWVLGAHAEGTHKAAHL